MPTDTTTVTLKHPITVGDKQVQHITLRRPLAGDLRNVNLAELMVMNTTQVARVVGRISTPLVPESAFWSLDSEDLGAVALEVSGFLTGSDAPSLPG